MLNDSKLNFVPIGSPLSLVGGAGVAIPSSLVIDILGSGVGTAPANIIGNVTLFGEDTGIGAVRPLIQVNIGTGLVTGNSATLNIAFQGAVDTGVGGGYLPGTYQTFEETGPLTAAQLTAGTVAARLDWAAAFPQFTRVRYLRLLFSPASATNFTAGTISSAIVTMDRDDQANRNAANNYVVA
jgi:hypothetical protein